MQELEAVVVGAGPVMTTVKGEAHHAAPGRASTGYDRARLLLPLPLHCPAPPPSTDVRGATDTTSPPPPPLALGLGCLQLNCCYWSPVAAARRCSCAVPLVLLTRQRHIPAPPSGCFFFYCGYHNIIIIIHGNNK